MKNPTIAFRKATSDDNFFEMARLLYESDPFIFPYWAKDEAAFAHFLESWMNADGFIFSFRNFFIAHQQYYRYPVAIMVTVDNRTQSCFNYDALRQQSQQSAVITDQYLGKIVNTCSSLPDDVAYGVALCVAPALRGRGIGSGLFESTIRKLKKRGINTLYFDCLEENYLARKMYEKHGCELVSSGIGFDGTTNPTVKTVTYAVNF